MRRILFAAVFLAALAGLGAAALYLNRVAHEIERQSTIEEAQPADAIVVLGAAEYRGKPSPVLEARLNHALWLYLNTWPRSLLPPAAPAAIRCLPKAPSAARTSPRTASVRSRSS